MFLLVGKRRYPRRNRGMARPRLESRPRPLTSPKTFSGVSVFRSQDRLRLDPPRGLRQASAALGASVPLLSTPCGVAPVSASESPTSPKNPIDVFERDHFVFWPLIAIQNIFFDR